MSQVTAITDIRTVLKAARAAWATWTPLVMEWDGMGAVDFSAQVKPFICAEIVFLDGHQLELSKLTPLSVQYGQIHLTAFAKIGQAGGVLSAASLIDHFRPYLERKNLSLVRTHVAASHKSFEWKGWEGYPLLVPFWYHRLAS